MLPSTPRLSPSWPVAGGPKGTRSSEDADQRPTIRTATLEHRAFYALTRFLSVPDSELMVLRDSLQRWDPTKAAEEGDGLFRDHRGLHPYLRLYLLGLLSAR